MADSGVNVTEGSGLVVDSRTEATNGNHRQVVVLGDPSTNAGVAPVDATAGLKVDLGADNDVTVAGVSTAANQSTIIGHLDGVEGLLTTIDADTGSILTSVDGLETSNSAIQTAVQLIDDTVQVLGTDTYTEAASKGITLGAVRRDADTSLVNTTNEFGPLQMDANGRLKVEAFSGEALPITDNSGSLTVDAPVGTPAFVRLSDGAAAITTLPVSLASVPSHAVTNVGTFVTQENGAALTAMQLLDDTIFTDDAAFTPGTSKVSAIGLMADETSTDSVDEGDIGIPRMTTDRKQIATLYPSAGTTDGVAVANFNTGDTFTALTNSAQVIKASAGNFYGYYIYNPNSAATYVMLYNVAAASVTVGTTTPAMVFCIPATAGANLSLAYPIPFTNAGWSIAATTTGGGNTAPATALEAMIFYK